MRRSSDGHISATGMFKAAFPWSEVDDEEAERRYIIGLPTTSSDQTAGNVWIPPAYALQLAEEYGILQWITAMLDNKKIETNNTKDQPPKAISPPPKYLLPQPSLTAPTPTRLGRTRRSASPSKFASPRKAGPTPRKTKSSKASSTSTDSHTKAANKSLQQALKQAATAGDSDISTPEPSEPRASVAPEDSPNTDDSQKEVKEEDVSEEATEEPKVTVTVEKSVVVKDEVETTKTHVEVEMPAGLPELPLPEDGAAMIAKAKEMVDAANAKEKAARTSAEVSLPKRAKRKADEVEDDDDAVVEFGSVGAPVPKKAKIETELKREKVKTRALIGISATLAIGAMIPYISTLF